MDFMLLFVGFLLLIFAPFEMYLANTEEFWFNIFDFGGYLLMAFAIYVLTVVCFHFITKHFKRVRIISYAVFIIATSLYIQGNYILFDYGELDGIAIDWSKYVKEGIVSVSFFAIVLIMGVLFYVFTKDKEKLYKWGDRLAICLTLMLVLTLVTLLISENGLDDKMGYVVTDRGETEYSKVENFIVIVLDTYDARVFDDLYNNGYKKELENTFADFTWYRNTISTYRLTDFSLPEVLTGKCYLNDMEYGEYLENSYENSELLEKLSDKGYIKSLYLSTPIPQGKAAEQIDNWDICKIQVSSHRRLLEHLYKLVGFRYMPHPLKRFFWTYTGEIDDIRIVEFDGDRQINPVSWGNDKFRESICNISCNIASPKFTFIHLRGIHAPRTLDSEFNRVEDGVSLEESAKGMNLMLSEYLAKLKEIGIYNDSIIVIMADHGAYDYDSGYGQSPLFMVKYRNENNEFSIDETPLAFDMMERIFICFLDGDSDGNISGFSSDGDRYHYETEWSDTLKSNERAKDFVEYAITGHAFETDKIHETGVHY